MKSLAIIPARGGSKRIPRKNVRDFIGKPIMAYSVEAALSSGSFDEVMVSTDDEEIASIAKKCGAKVPFMRSKESSNDVAGLTDVCLEVVRCYESLGRKFDAVCCILATAPLLSSKKIIIAKNILENGVYDCVFTVVEYCYPIQRSLKISNGFVKMRWPENYHIKSQDFEKTYHDAGQFYFIKTKALYHEEKLFVEKSQAIILSSLEAQDIDTEIDWKLTELKYKLNNPGK